MTKPFDRGTLIDRVEWLASRPRQLPPIGLLASGGGLVARLLGGPRGRDLQGVPAALRDAGRPRRVLDRDLHHVQPARVPGRVVEFQSSQDAAGLGRLEAGVARRRSPPAAPAWCPLPTTSSRWRTCCSGAARSAASGSSPPRPSRR